ncbi:hypothetical protein P3T35_003133 [Kitasatospora sp. GP30]|uniref:hypothetical protein n=1 Tax=Kitasatospora sp. GP30 TaxID=3035084 RepID=UPI000C710C0E|nr:hypothetical protein [Kitasatospora sp. GP30]MDH6141120.1 hypothetical protein [Kitasatospora sp. GP30]
MFDADITADRPAHWPDERPRRIFHLSVPESTGPFEDSAGYEHGQPCPGCQQRPEHGADIVRLGNQWWHLRCAAHHMRTSGAAAAWLALGADLAARPSAYSVTETRAIVRQLLAITTATDAPPCPDCALNRTWGELAAPNAGAPKTDDDEWVRCSNPRCHSGERFAKATGRGWQAGHMGTWLCPNCRITTQED